MSIILLGTIDSKESISNTFSNRINQNSECVYYVTWYENQAFTVTNPDYPIQAAYKPCLVSNVFKAPRGSISGCKFYFDYEYARVADVRRDMIQKSEKAILNQSPEDRRKFPIRSELQYIKSDRCK